MQVQQKLKAPKGQRNNFGNYNYRSCEDIVEAVKPLLENLILTINDEIVVIGDRYYVKATASLTDGESEISNTAYAREALSKKGMDEAQITGSASSYARKYALNGLLCIDDTKDPDATNNHESSDEPVMPFGKTKGQKLSEISIQDLTNALAWCQGKNDKNQFDKLIKDIENSIKKRN